MKNIIPSHKILHNIFKTSTKLAPAKKVILIVKKYKEHP